VKATESRKQIRDLSSDELKTKAQELKGELFKARIQNHTNQLDSSAKLRGLRRDIARINTVLTQRESQAEAKS
jgi:large subunit ribosomal protein L29